MVVIPAITIVGKRLYALYDTRIKNDEINKYLKIATDCVIDSVGDVAQTYVDKLSDSEWNIETKQEAFNRAKEEVLRNLGISGQKVLNEALGDFDNWIKAKIQSEVKKLSIKQEAVK
jgi:hypothetical protein